ncbi:MAG: DUF1015 domain-containing protein [Candidatus Zixiibacteriota bacterium]
MCASPPYDQYTDRLVAQLEAQSPYNIARVIKPPANGGPDATGRRYRDARAILQSWINDGVLAADSGPSIYPYLQSYMNGSYEVTRNGFIALGDLRDTRWFTHEETHAHVREDRARLRKATEADIGLIFMIYSDPHMSIDRLLRHCDFGSPILMTTQPDGSTHRVYRCGQESFIDRLARQMTEFDCVIADGHHRTAAAFDTWREMQDEHWAYAMMAFFNADAPGTAVRPIHRLVARSDGWKFDQFLEKLADRFSVQEITTENLSSEDTAKRLESIVNERAEQGRIAFGMVGPHAHPSYVVDAPEPAPSDWAWPYPDDESYRRLATAVFEVGILRASVGLNDAEIAEGRGLKFPRDITTVTESVRSGKYQLGFILPPTPLSAVFDVARKRHNLPQESTHFFPKLLSGLVINRIHETNTD